MVRNQLLLGSAIFMFLNIIHVGATTSQPNAAMLMIRQHLQKESALKITLLRTLKAVIGDVKKLKTEREEQTQLIDSLRREVLDLRTSMMEMREVNNEQNNKLSVIQKTQASHNVTFMDLSDASHRVQRDLERLSSDNFKQKQTVQTMQETVTSYGRDINSLLASSSISDRNVKLLMEEDIELNRKVNAFSEVHNHQNRKLQDLNEKYVSQERKINSVVADSSKLSRNLQSLLDENAKRVVEINSLKDTALTTTRELEKLSQNNVSPRREEPALSSGNTILFRQVTAMKEKNDEQDQEIEELERENTVQAGDIKTLTAEYMAQSKLIQLLRESIPPINQGAVSDDYADAISPQPVQMSGDDHPQRSETPSISPAALKLQRDVELLHHNVSSVNEKILSLENNQRYIHSHIHDWRVNDKPTGSM